MAKIEIEKIIRRATLIGGLAVVALSPGYRGDHLQVSEPGTSRAGISRMTDRIPSGCKYVQYESGPHSLKTCSNEYVCPQPVGSLGLREKGTDLGIGPWYIREHCEWVGGGGGTCGYFQEIWWGRGCAEGEIVPSLN